MKAAFRALCAVALAALATGPVKAATVTITVLDSHSNPVAGATAKWNTGSWHTVPGSTDANGQLTFDVTEPYSTVVVSYHQTSASKTMAQVQSAGYAPVYQTVDARIRLVDSDGNGLAGGVAQQGQGAWIGIGTTQADGYLNPNWEVFTGGPYQYSMAVNHSSQTLYMAANGLTDNVFQTGSIDFGSQTAHWAHGSHYYFSGVVQLLPGAYHMDIAGVGFDFTIGGGSSGVGRLLTLRDADGHGLAGGRATPATGGSWNATAAGATDGSGHLFAMLPSGFTKIRMTVNQSSQQLMKADLEANNYTWQTSEAVIYVNDHDGHPLAGVQIDQGGGYWDINKGITGPEGMITVPIFAGASPKFRANWNHTSQTVTKSIVDPFQFRTGAVHLTTGHTCSKWATGSWNTFTQDMEVFPGTYGFVIDGTRVNMTIAGGASNDIP